MKESILCIDTSINPAIAAVVEFEDGRLQVAAHQELSDDLQFFSIWKEKITSCVVIISPLDFVSLSIDLQLADPKSIARVIDIEVQDVFPFETEDFLIQHKVLPQLPNLSTDVHVSLFPKERIRSILKWCETLGVQPAIVTTPSSIAAAVFHLEGEASAASHRAAIISHGDYVHCTTWFQGVPRTERAIPLSNQQDIFTALRQALVSAEHRYGAPIDEVLLLGNHLPIEALRNSLKVTVTKVALPAGIEEETAPAVLGTFFGQEERGSEILTNLRTREFSFNPYIKELKRLFFALLLPFAIFSLGWVLFSAGLYFSRNHQLATLQRASSEKISVLVPNLTVQPGEEVKALKVENAKLEQQLKDLGSPASINPLEALTSVTNDIADSALSIRKMSIRGNHIVVEGGAPDYAAVERIERELKKKNDLYCRVKKDTATGIPGQPDKRSFTLDIWLCD
jgi:hypothetical protein